MMRSWMALLAVAFLVGAVAACQADRDEIGVTMADSAGLEVVTNRRIPSGLPVRVIPGAPDREIRDEAFFQITGLAALPHGALAVGVNGAGSVLVYDSAGERTSTLGRTGDGPGEFRSVGSLVVLPGDSLGVYDSRLKRLTVFPLMGGSPREVSLAEVAPQRGGSRILPLDEDLVFVGEAGLGDGGEEGVYRNEETSYRVSLDGAVLATYGDFPGLEAFVGSNMMGRAPFGAVLATATWKNDFIVGTGERPEVRTYLPDGTLSRIVRWPDADRTVTQERWDQFVDFMLSPATTRAGERHEGPSRGDAARRPDAGAHTGADIA